MTNLTNIKSLVRRRLSETVLLVVAMVLLHGCNSMADLEREISIVIEQDGQEGIGGTGIDRSGEDGQEGIGGSGLDPDVDGIGGTGIIGLVENQSGLSVGGIQLRPSDDVAVFIGGEPASLGQLASGQTAAVLVDAGSQVQQINVLTNSSGAPGFLQQVEKLVLRGDIAQLAGSGIRIPETLASTVKTGTPVQVRATATSSGVFRVESVTPVNLEAPQVLPAVIRPTVSDVAPQGISQPSKPKVRPVQQAPDVPLAPVQPAQPVITVPPVTQPTPEPVTPAPAQPVRVPVVDVVSPVSVGLPTATATQPPAVDASSSVQSVSPPAVTEPPVVTTPPANPKSPDIAVEVMQPDTTATNTNINTNTRP